MCAEHFMFALFRLLLPTPTQFLDYFLQAAVSEEDLHVGVKIKNTEKVGVFIQKYANYFLEVILQGILLPSFYLSARNTFLMWCLF